METAKRDVDESDTSSNDIIRPSFQHVGGQFPGLVVPKSGVECELYTFILFSPPQSPMWCNRPQAFNGYVAPNG